MYNYLRYALVAFAFASLTAPALAFAESVKVAKANKAVREALQVTLSTMGHICESVRKFTNHPPNALKETLVWIICSDSNIDTRSYKLIYSKRGAEITPVTYKEASKAAPPKELTAVGLFGELMLKKGYTCGSGWKIQNYQRSQRVVQLSCNETDAIVRTYKLEGIGNTTQVSIIK